MIPTPATYARLAAAVEGLTRRGFTEHFEVAGDRLRALESGKVFGADGYALALWRSRVLLSRARP